MRFWDSPIVRAYPVLLELAVEATYPMDEAIVTATIKISSAIQGVVIMQMDAILKRPAEEKFVGVNFFQFYLPKQLTLTQKLPDGVASNPRRFLNF